MILTIPSKSLVFTADIHGDFQALLKIMKPYSDTCFIVCGDCGFGFPDTKTQKIQRMIKANFDAGLEKRNNYILFFRGNHDDPSYFKLPTMSHINTNRFRLIPDFTCVNVAGESVMCIGGAVSIDRRFRKTNSSYWLNEELSLESFPMTTSENWIVYPKITILATHSAPREYVSAYTPKLDWIRRSFSEDKKLEVDCDREDQILRNMYKNFPAPIWIHGHYHISNRMPIEHGELISLNINETYSIKSKDYYEGL